MVKAQPTGRSLRASEVFKMLNYENLFCYHRNNAVCSTQIQSSVRYIQVLNTKYSQNLIELQQLIAKDGSTLYEASRVQRAKEKNQCIRTSKAMLAI